MVKIPTFENQAEQTSEGGSIMMNPSIYNPSAASAKYRGQQDMANSVTQLAGVVNSFAQKEREVRETTEAIDGIKKINNRLMDIEQASLLLPVSEREAFLKTNYGNLSNTIKNGGLWDFNVQVDNGKGSFDTISYYQGNPVNEDERTFKPASSNRVEKVLIDKFAQLEISSLKSAREFAIKNNIANLKLSQLNSVDMNIQGAIGGFRRGDLTVEYQHINEVFAIDVNPKSPTYWVNMLAQGLDPQQGPDAFDIMVANNLLTTAEAEEQRVKKWREYLKGKISVQEASLANLGDDAFYEGYSDLINSLQGDIEYNNITHGLDQDWLAVKVGKLTEDRTREENRRNIKAIKASNDETRYIENQQDQITEEMFSFINNPEIEVSEEEILELNIKGKIVTDLATGKQRLVKITDAQYEKLLKAVRGKTIYSEGAHRQLLTKISNLNTMRGETIGQLKTEIQSSGLDPNTTQNLLNALDTKVKNTPKYLEYKKNRDDLEYLLKGSGIKTYVQGQDKTNQNLIEDTLRYYDTITLSGLEGDHDAAVAKDLAFAFYSANDQTNSLFGLSPKVISAMGGVKNFNKLTTKDINDGINFIQNTISGGGGKFHLGALTTDLNRLEAMLGVHAARENVQTTNNAQQGKNQSNINMNSKVVQSQIKAEATQADIDDDLKIEDNIKQITRLK